MGKDITREQMSLLDEMLKNRQSEDVFNVINGAGASSPMLNDNFVPISNGNSVIVNQYLEIYRNGDAEVMRWYIMFCNYFSNLFDIETENEQLKQAFKQFMKTLFWFGTASIDKKGDNYNSYGIVVQTIDPNQDIIKYKTWVSNLSFMGNFKTSVEEADMSEGKGVAGKFNHAGIAGIWWFARLVKDINMLLTSFRVNAIFNTKKIKYTVKNNNSKVIQEEIRTMFDPAKPFILSYNSLDTADAKNVIEELNSVGNFNSELVTQIKKYLGLMYAHLGIEASSTDKKERVIGAEFEGEKIFAKLMLNEYKTELEMFIKRFNKKFKENIKLVSNIEKFRDENSEEVLRRDEVTEEVENEL